jgi:hypothetical protein
MNKNNGIESSLFASKWGFKKNQFEIEIADKFRLLQICAFHLELSLRRNNVEVKSLDYFYDKKSTYLQIYIEQSSIENFYETSNCFWSLVHHYCPVHRNDTWIKQCNRPNVSKFYFDAANGNLVIDIKFNNLSKRYDLPSVSELKAIDCANVNLNA